MWKHSSLWSYKVNKMYPRKYKDIGYFCLFASVKKLDAKIYPQR